MKVRLRNILRPTMRAWLPFFAAITLLCLTATALVQQSVRQAADDPQLEFSEQLAEQLKGVPDPSSFLGGQTQTDLRTSLGVFAIAYGDDLQPLASTGVLDGETPKLPEDVLQHAKDHGENRVTWEPKDGVRIAAVIKKYQLEDKKENFVLVGRSMREVESREADLLAIGFMGWAVTNLVVLVLLGAEQYKTARANLGESQATSTPAAAPAKPARSRNKRSSSRWL